MRSFALTLLPLVQLASATHAPSRKTCVVPSSGGVSDDSAAIANVFARCSNNSIIKFSQGVDYNVFQPISATNLSNVEISMQGNLHLPQNVTAIQAIVNETTGSAQATNLYWFSFAGPKIDWVGTSNITNGWIYSYGQAWWDLNPVNGTGTPARPHLMSFITDNGSMQHWKSKKPIAWNVALSGNNVTVTNAIIDAVSNSSSFPFNTDGFDVKGNNISILDSTIYNGDDAIAIGSGSHNILFRGNTIGYQTHGMSIGSLGQTQSAFANVTNVLIDSNTVAGGVYAARFKSWIGGQGLAKNITWSNIKVYNVSFPIFVTQSYSNQGSAQTQLQPGAVTGRPNNSSVVMQDFTWANFTGTINTFNHGDDSCVTDVSLPDISQTRNR